jgi:hypothetical protein
MHRETLAELRRLRTPDPEPEPQPVADTAPQPIDPTPASPQIGFVPSNQPDSLAPGPRPLAPPCLPIRNHI